MPKPNKESLASVNKEAARTVLNWINGRSRREIELGLARLREAFKATGQDIEEAARG